MRSNAATPIAPVRALLARTSSRTRIAIVLVAILGAVARMTLVLTARAIGRGDVALSIAAGCVVALATALLRVAQGRARVGVECDLYRAAARSLVEGDVLSAPARDVQQAVFESEPHARTLLAVSLPGLAADVLVCLAATPILAAALATRVLGIAFAALVAVFLAVIALRRVTQKLQERTLGALQRVVDGVLVAIEGRLEVVARGGEERYQRELDTRLDAYARVSSGIALRSALVGRLPLVAGVLTVAVVVVADGSSRDALGVAVLGEALLLASVLPAVLGVAVGGHDIARASARVSPLVEIIASPRRREVEAPGEPPPEPPFDVVVDDVTFRYAGDGEDVLTNVSVEWPRGRALVVTGANGAGKSTLLRLLLGLGVPRTGDVRVGGKSLASLDLRALRRGMAYLPQRPYLGEPYTTIREAMRIGESSASDDALIGALDRVAILAPLKRQSPDPLDVRLGTLSAGQRQRVALARLLLHDAPVLVLDEPDADLDRDGVAFVASLVEELTKKGRMVAVAAHSAELMTKDGIRVELT